MLTGTVCDQGSLSQPDAVASRRARTGDIMKEIELPQAAPREEDGHVRALTILERSIYRGPGFFRNRPMIGIKVDLGTREGGPTDRRPIRGSVGRETGSRVVG